ncbi:hypothetical protein AC578_6053 [Pseudocercospora eumusae]|uniref:Uncharacterized protein n=1 Tax=Pseudocercospora eumusae TaxID=321146 RepID=A0A139HVK7_9PEZI|nr:hypothetical protein AC578_6053 [Pseudocercospora eumusae]
MLASTILGLLGLTATITALPQKRSCISADDLTKIAPNTTSCQGATYPEECATAEAAAPNIGLSFREFKIPSFGAQAALVSIMLFETGDFKYNRNHFPAPGTPGQGTRNMQSPTFNQKYAEWIAANGKDESISPAKVTAAAAQGPAEVLALINASDKWSFASAAWFLKTQCEASVETALADGTQASYEAYLTDCVGTTVTDDRITGWEAVVALKQW